MDIPRPDSTLVEAFAASPNHGERRGGRKPDCVILHYTGMPTGEGALERLRDPASEVSSHYFIWENGRIWQLVPEARRAWHAGASCWQGETDLNSASIGIEIVNQGHVDGVPAPFPDAQIKAVAALCCDIGQRHLIDPKRFLAHSDIAPGRKIDPGEAFPWERLAALGVGHWPKSPDVTHAPAVSECETGNEIKALQTALAAYGYHIQADGVFGPRTKAVVEAFQRRFRRARVDGVVDAETRAVLASLLA